MGKTLAIDEPMTEEEARNVKAFLKVISWCEHDGKIGDELYYVIYGARDTFKDTKSHPNVKVTRWGRTSTAAGAYQIRKPSWDEAVSRGIISDFTPASQDRYAMWQLSMRHAFKAVKAGKVEFATRLLHDEWTSLPGGKEAKKTDKDVRAQFNIFVSELRAAAQGKSE